MPWNELRHPVCLLKENGVVACTSPPWSLLTQGTDSPWLWPKGVNVLERLRSAGHRGDIEAAEAADSLQSILRGSDEQLRRQVSLSFDHDAVPFLWTAVAVRAPQPGAVVSLFEQQPQSGGGAAATATIDDRGRLVEYNRDFAELLGFEPEMAGSSLWELLALRDGPLAAVLQATLPSLSASELKWFWQPSQSWLEVRWFPNSDLTQLAFCVLCPKKARLARAVEHSQGRLAERGNLEAIQRLAGGVAHDFNNRLTEILGNAELALASPEISDDLRGAFESIAASAHRSAALVRQLLAFSRQETISPKTLDLNSAIEDLLKLRKELEDERIRLTWTPSPETLLIKADPAQIHQILDHLVSNARDAVLRSGDENGGEIRISTGQRIVDEETSRRHSSVTPGLFAKIEVSDTGCGLDQEMAPKIFEPFFTTKQTGSGMGLSTVQGIVGQNGGFVEVISEPGKGSSFQIALPSRRLDDSVEHPVSGPTSAGPTDEVSGTPRPRTVLLVDDEPGLLKLCERRLLRLGCQVLVAHGSNAALDLARSHPGQIDLLLTDVMMPDLNGHELCLLLREIRPEMSALFMSGYAAEILTQNGMLDAGVHFLPKPFAEAELREAMRKALALKPSEAL
jgi:signal transduction histidine kinase/ActR/RegA family two-component response regulator